MYEPFGSDLTTMPIHFTRVIKRVPTFLKRDQVPESLSVPVNGPVVADLTGARLAMVLAREAVFLSALTIHPL